MSNTSCIQHPIRSHYLAIHQWQIDACEGDTCGAALLSFFIGWHDTKLKAREQAKLANSIAETHGDPPAQDESLFQFHAEEGLEDGIFRLYTRRTIRKSLKTLERLGFLSVHANPNPRYSFDRTRHFLLHPPAINQYIKDWEKTHPETEAIQKSPDPSGKNAGWVESGPRNQTYPQMPDFPHQVKIPHDEVKIPDASGKNTSTIPYSSYPYSSKEKDPLSFSPSEKSSSVEKERDALLFQSLEREVEEDHPPFSTNRELHKRRARSEAIVWWNLKFDEFWAEHPIKRGKPKALRAWMVISPKTQEKFDDIMSGLQREKEDRIILHARGDFTPEWKYPQGWLSQEYWTQGLRERDRFSKYLAALEEEDGAREEEDV